MDNWTKKKSDAKEITTSHKQTDVYPVSEQKLPPQGSLSILPPLSLVCLACFAKHGIIYHQISWVCLDQLYHRMCPLPTSCSSLACSPCVTKLGKRKGLGTAQVLLSNSPNNGATNTSSHKSKTQHHTACYEEINSISARPSKTVYNPSQTSKTGMHTCQTLSSLGRDIYSLS